MTTAPVGAPSTDWGRANADFVARLHDRFLDDAGARSSVRASFRRTPDQAVSAHPFVIPLGPPKGPSPAHYAVASWVARFNGKGTSGLSIGRAVREARTRATDDGLDKRLADLGRCSEHMLLTNRLPSLLTLLDSRGKLPDLGLLLGDLRQWNNHSGRVFRHWMKDLYLPRSTTSTPAPDTASPTA